MAYTHGPDQPLLCQIRVQGHLSCHWSAWFEGLTVTLEECGDTVLSGHVADQAALHGLLKKVRDAGLPLVAVNCMQAGAAAALTAQPETTPP